MLYLLTRLYCSGSRGIHENNVTNFTNNIIIKFLKRFFISIAFSIFDKYIFLVVRNRK